MSSRYREVPTRVDLPALDHGVLALWRAKDVFARSLRQTEGGPEWVFYEGPPTANGMPGTHHIEARVFKDVFPRFKTMRGFHVARKAGWDCHGLPVELAVEQELGFNGKQEIEAYGIAEFNARCRESVLRHADAFGELTERMGYWVDLDQAYRTMDPGYIESVWWALARIHRKGLLVQDYRVTPWCPRCGTALSDHELAQGYQTVHDPSVFIRFPLTSGPLAGEADLLVWTTTPWTLVGNTAVSAHADVEYVVATDGKLKLVIARALLERVLGAGWSVVGRSYTGAEMERWQYQRPFTMVELEGANFVVNGEHVTTEAGTGLVHTTPAFGEDDFKVCQKYGMPVADPMRPDGTFKPGLGLVGGVYFKDADEIVLADLAERGLLFRREDFEHSYPHCWRCHTPLYYHAQPSWYIRTTAIRNELLRENAKTAWYPETVKTGRYGDWLENNVDWALSRSRYWGTPLPIWRCPDGHLTCVSSLAELSELTGRDQSGLDPHRPFVDEVGFGCTAEGCGGQARRVPEVVDAWFDSGAMPFAQWGYPYRNKEKFEGGYPAQFISEAIDQTRGWFYTLMAVGTLVFDRSSYETVVCLGHILAEDGRKMSKHLGNILEPIPLMERYGADAVRWFMAASGSPWAARRVGHGTLQEVVRRTLLTYWNSAAFQSLYGRGAHWSPGPRDPQPRERAVLDRWALSELNILVREVTAAFEDFDTQRAGRLLSGFVDDLSNWYVRRSRRRFWKGDPGALRTLHDVLRTVTLLMAPLVPFITERVWQDLFVPTESGADIAGALAAAGAGAAAMSAALAGAGGAAGNGAAADSVHLMRWPEPDSVLIDEELSRQVALARRLVELGRAARAESGVKTRQPLARALIAAEGFAQLGPQLRAEIAEELNVQELRPLAEVAGEFTDITVKADFRVLGRRFGKRVQAVARAIAQADGRELSARLRTGTGAVEVDGETVPLALDEVVITQVPREGWSVASEAGAAVALDLALTPQLRRAGLAREAVRLIQEARKDSGLQVTDRIVLHWSAADGELAAALSEHGGLVAEEVLATVFARSDGEGSGIGNGNGKGNGRNGAGGAALYFSDASLGLAFRLAKATA